MGCRVSKLDFGNDNSAYSSDLDDNHFIRKAATTVIKPLKKTPSFLVHYHQTRETGHSPSSPVGGTANNPPHKPPEAISRPLSPKTATTTKKADRHVKIDMGNNLSINEKMTSFVKPDQKGEDKLMENTEDVVDKHEETKKTDDDDDDDDEEEFRTIPSTNEVPHPMNPSIQYSSLRLQIPNDIFLDSIQLAMNQYHFKPNQDIDAGDDDNNDDDEEFLHASSASDNITGDVNHSYRIQKRMITNMTRHLRNVFAVPMSTNLDGNDDSATHDDNNRGVLSLHPHDEEVKDFLRTKLHEHYLFEALPENELSHLVDAFESYQLDMDETDHILIRQGECIANDNAYFYILYEGSCEFLVNDAVVGVPALLGNCFGELALLYDCPRAATVRALTSKSAVRFFRLHQKVFRRILRQENEHAEIRKLKLLDNVVFLQHITNEQRTKLAYAMKMKVFEKGEMFARKGDQMLPYWTIIEKGTTRATNIDISDGNKSGYSDVVLQEGEYFGERTILQGKVARYDIVADTDGLAFTIEQEVLKSVLGDKTDKLVEMSVDVKKMRGIPVFAETIRATDSTKLLGYLASQIQEEPIPKGKEICVEGQPLSQRALYFVRTGKVLISSSSQNTEDTIGADFFFGEDQLLGDCTYHKTSDIPLAKYTAKVIEDCVLGVLKIESCRRVFNTKEMMNNPCLARNQLLDSLMIRPTHQLTINDFDRHTILGAGTFGQVWLASRNDKTSSNDKSKPMRPYAIKIQSKYELVKHGQAKSVVHEKKVMEELHHPFVGGMVTAFQDTTFIYMVLPFIQGGELYKVMSLYPKYRVVEEHAMFYISCITEGLTYMHRKGLVYR